MPGGRPPREAAAHTAPLEGEWGRPMSQALELHRLPCLHRRVLRDCGGIRRAWGWRHRGQGGGEQRSGWQQVLGPGDLPKD